MLFFHKILLLFYCVTFIVVIFIVFLLFLVFLAVIKELLLLESERFNEDESRR